MTKQKIALLIFAVLLLPFSAFADNATSTATSTPLNTITNTSTTTPGSVLVVKAPVVPEIITQIKQAKQILNTVTLNYDIKPVYKTAKATKKNPKPKAVISSYNLNAKDIALAILDPATNQIGIAKGMQTGKSIVFSDPNFDITLSRFNGVNSSFKINKPPNGTVLALKYLITGPESGSKASIVNAMQEAMYVPYSDNLNRTDVIAYGETYIDNLIEKVTAELEHIPSQAVPGKMIPEAIKPSYIRALVYAEHTDTATVLQGGNIQDTINRLNILFATNEGDAYKYSVSTASARGIAQFIPSTYLALVQRHNEAGLISDFNIGMADHYNSIKAMYLLLDDYAGAVRVKAQSGFAEGQVFDYGAASYNGGTTRVIRAINAFGPNWNQDQSAQVNALQSQVNGLTAQVKSLKAKVKSTKDKKTKAELQSQLNTASVQLNDASGQLDTIKSAALRNETVNYLQKIYKVIPLFNDQQI